MLLSANRLKRKRDFDITYTNGRFFRGENITLKVWKVDPGAFPKRGFSLSDLKVGVVVGKKVDKRAVRRNRVKRLVREVFRLIIKADSLRSGFFIICMVRPLSEGVEYVTIEKDIRRTLKKAGVLKTR